MIRQIYNNKAKRRHFGFIVIIYYLKALILHLYYPVVNTLILFDFRYF